MRRHGAAMVGLLAAMTAGACADGATGPAAGREAAARPAASIAPAHFARFVSIGTSISMGWASNGVYAGSQQTSWPAQLARLAGAEMTLPLIEDPGCTSPIVAPLALATRRSGESVAGSTVCAPNAAGVRLPAQNVAIAGALAYEVLSLTPEAAGAAKPFYARVLPPGVTQLQAALAQRPEIVSVELGGNEVLQASRGLVAPGVTVVPVDVYRTAMANVLHYVAESRAKAVVFGLPRRGENLPSLRRADEIWAARGVFAAMYVIVAADCETSPNWVNVSTKVLTTLYTAQQLKARGLPMPTLSCADVPGTMDDVVTPADMAWLNSALAHMNGVVSYYARMHGFAVASLGALYDRADLKGPYNPAAQLTSPAPYGPLISLDAIHPSAAGAAVLADAAAAALNARYGFGIPLSGAGALVALAN